MFYPQYPVYTEYLNATQSPLPLDPHLPMPVLHDVATYVSDWVTVSETCMNPEQCLTVPSVLLPVRPLIPVQQWESLVFNYRKGNLRGVLSVLKRAGPILKEHIIPILSSLKEYHRNRQIVVNRPRTVYI